MNKIFKGAVLGGAIGVIAPVTMVVANEFLFSLRSGGKAEPRICFAERLWNLQRVQVVNAKGCRNKILDSIPYCLAVGVLGGSLQCAISLLSKKNFKTTSEVPTETSKSTPPSTLKPVSTPPISPIAQLHKTNISNASPPEIPVDTPSILPITKRSETKISDESPTEKSVSKAPDQPVEKELIANKQSITTDRSLGITNPSIIQSNTPFWSRLSKRNSQDNQMLNKYVLPITFLITFTGSIAIAYVSQKQNADVSPPNTAVSPPNAAEVETQEPTEFTVMSKQGYKYFFKKEGITCRKNYIPPFSYFNRTNGELGEISRVGYEIDAHTSTYCGGYGFSEDQVGKRVHYVVKTKDKYGEDASEYRCHTTGHNHINHMQQVLKKDSNDNASEWGPVVKEPEYIEPYVSTKVICIAAEYFRKI